MAHAKRDIKDRITQFPSRYKQTLVVGTTDTFDLVPVTGTVTQEGTKINKQYLQPIEDELERLGTDKVDKVAGKGLSSLDYNSTERDKFNTKVDKIEGRGLSERNYSLVEQDKLIGIAVGANKYTHPATHPATMIEDSASRRFTTDTEKVKLAGIAANANNYVHPSGTNPHGTTKSNVGLSLVDNNKQMPIAGGTFTGVSKAQANTSYTTSQLRNTILSAGNPSGGSNGDIWIKYV